MLNIQVNTDHQGKVAQAQYVRYPRNHIKGIYGEPNLRKQRERNRYFVVEMLGSPDVIKLMLVPVAEEKTEAQNM